MACAPAGTVALAALLTAGALSSRAPAQGGTPLAALFPKSGEVRGWQLHAPAKLFPGARVFDYMNGAGEIPKSYGLNQVGSTLYRKGAGTLEAAIFDMKTPEGAYGYCSVRGFLDRSPSGGDRIVRLDHPARLNTKIGILTFWKSHYTVILQPQDGKPDDASLLAFARLICRRLPSGGAPPALLRLLPAREAMAATRRYLKGRAAFDSALLFSPDDALGAAKGAEAVAQEAKLAGAEGTLAVVQYPNPGAAAAAFAGVRKLLTAHKAVFGAGASATRFTAFSSREKGAGALLDGRRLALVLFAGGKKESPQTGAVVSAALTRLQAAIRHPGPVVE
jgi:hypothetical protein